MLRLITLLIILIFLVKTTYGNGHAFIYIGQEHVHDYNVLSKKEKFQYTWTINGQVIKYKAGKYDIPLNAAGVFDTVRFQNIHPRYDAFPSGRPAFDTTITISLCKFKEGHNYNLAKITGGPFEIYSLDTFETRMTITFKAINNKNNDTLYLNAWYAEHAFFSDTTFTTTFTNDKLQQSFYQHIELKATKWVLDGPEFGPSVPDKIIFTITFLYLHAENLEIEYDFATKQYNLKLIN